MSYFLDENEDWKTTTTKYGPFSHLCPFFSLWPLHVTFGGIILQGLTLTASGLDQNSHYAPNSAIDVLAQSSAIVSTYHTMAKLWAKISMAELWSIVA